LKPDTLRVLVVNSPAEMYGSGKSLLDFARHRRLHMVLTVVLPELGPLVAALRDSGIAVLLGEVCKLQRRMLSPAALWQLVVSGRATLHLLRDLHRQRCFRSVYSNSLAVMGGALFAVRSGLLHVWHVRAIFPRVPTLLLGFRKLVLWLYRRASCTSGQTQAWIARGGPCHSRLKQLRSFPPQGVRLSSRPTRLVWQKAFSLRTRSIRFMRSYSLTWLAPVDISSASTLASIIPTMAMLADSPVQVCCIGLALTLACRPASCLLSVIHCET